MNAADKETVDVGANDVDFQKAIGADDGSVVGNAVEAIKGAAGKIADKFHPLIEQYAGLFKTGLRTPVMRKPSDYGMDFEECWFPRARGWWLSAPAGRPGTKSWPASSASWPG